MLDEIDDVSFSSLSNANLWIRWNRLKEEGIQLLEKLKAKEQASQETSDYKCNGETDAKIPKDPHSPSINSIPDYSMTLTSRNDNSQVQDKETREDKGIKVEEDPVPEDGFALNSLEISTCQADSNISETVSPEDQVPQQHSEATNDDENETSERYFDSQAMEVDN